MQKLPWPWNTRGLCSATGEGNGTHSSTLAWKIPWTEEPGGLQSMGSRRVGQDWLTSLTLFTFMHWRRKWQPTPVFLPGEFQGCDFVGNCDGFYGEFWRNSQALVGCRLRGHTESDKTEVTAATAILSHCLLLLTWGVQMKWPLSLHLSSIAVSPILTSSSHFQAI